MNEILVKEDITIEDLNNLNWLQFVTSYDSRKHSSTLPYVFTEQGVTMLATILRTNVATEISIQIMDAFVAMKKYISSNLFEQKYINNQVIKNTNDIRLLQSYLQNYQLKKKIITYFLKGKYMMLIH